MGNVGEIPKKVKNKYTLFGSPKQTKGKLKENSFGLFGFKENTVRIQLRKEGEERGKQ